MGSGGALCSTTGNQECMCCSVRSYCFSCLRCKCFCALLSVSNPDAISNQKKEKKILSSYSGCHTLLSIICFRSFSIASYVVPVPSFQWHSLIVVWYTYLMSSFLTLCIAVMIFNEINVVAGRTDVLLRLHRRPASWNIAYKAPICINLKVDVLSFVWHFNYRISVTHVIKLSKSFTWSPALWGSSSSVEGASVDTSWCWISWITVV